MQSAQLCTWVIFIFRHAQQIIRRNAQLVRQPRNGERADVLGITALILADGRSGKLRLLRKLFQRQVLFYPQILDPLRCIGLYLHRVLPSFPHP